MLNEQQPWYLSEEDVKLEVEEMLKLYTAEQIRNMLSDNNMRERNTFSQELEGRNIDPKIFERILDEMSPK